MNIDQCFAEALSPPSCTQLCLTWVDVYGLVSRNADTLKRLNDAERTLRDRKEKAYINLDVSNEEREKGNQVCVCFVRTYPSRPLLALSCLWPLDHSFQVKLCAFDPESRSCLSGPPLWLKSLDHAQMQPLQSLCITPRLACSDATAAILVYNPRISSFFSEGTCCRRSRTRTTRRP